MVESIAVGMITDAAGTHLAEYLSALSTCQGVERIALAESTGSMFEKARSLVTSRFSRLQTFYDELTMLKVVRPRLALVAVAAHRAPRP